MRNPLRKLATALAATALVVPGAAVTATPGSAAAAAAEPITYTVGPGADLLSAMEDLAPGDTLRLLPGTYEAGLVRPVIKQGTATAPITVRAADPARRPLIKGAVRLWGPSYWRLDGLRIQGTLSRSDSLFLGGGEGWSVRNSEIWGARQTKALSNVAIASDILRGTGSPKRFVFSDNCVHDGAGTSTRDHNMYVTFQGDAQSGGVIQRNVIYGHLHGAGIKLGAGGDLGALGPWGVTVRYNTIADGGRHILMHANVRNNVLHRNLFAFAAEPFNKVPKTTSIYLNHIVGPGNRFLNNYAFSSSMFSYGTGVAFNGDNALRPNPKFNARNSCNGYRTTYAKAAAYGRYATGALPRW